jgi:hypothetical protein
MPKKIFFESAVHHFVAAGQKYCEEKDLVVSVIKRFMESLEFSSSRVRKSSFSVSWAFPHRGILEVDYSEASLYVRGDSERFIKKLKERNLTGPEDPIQKHNRDFFEKKFLEVALRAGFEIKEGKLTFI